MNEGLIISIHQNEDGWFGVLLIGSNLASTAEGHTRGQVYDMLLDAAQTWLK
jgi:hypothetical protein